MKTHRQRRKINKRAGAKLFAWLTLAACLIVVAFSILFIKRLPTRAGGASWLPGFSASHAIDSGPDPIVHNPSALAEQFLMSTSTSELARLARDDDNSPEILRDHAPALLRWLEGHREWTPLHEAKANGLIFTVFAVAHAIERTRPLYVVQTVSGPRVDIGAFLAWSSERWQDLASGRATSASIVRASVARISYYNYRFTDEAVYQSYRLDPPDTGHSLYGYVVRGTPTAVALEKLVPRGRSFPLVLSLADGESGSNRRQFRITRALAAGWAMGPEFVEDLLPALANDPQLFAPAGDGATAPADR